MKIRLAILEKDESYLNRLVTAFSTRYADKFELYSFTDLAIAMQTLESAKIDVLVADDALEIDFDAIPKRCGFAYLVDYADIESLNDQRAIFKFQKADVIYKQILSIYSENAGNVSGLKLGDDASKIIMFSSPTGGAGTSCAAAACAMHYALQNKRVLYLNLEKFGTPDIFFTGEGSFDMSDIIYALKSRKVNLSLKLESCVKQDKSGVYFYSQSKVALDMLELTADDIAKLISELKLNGSYEYIIVDTDFSFDKDTLSVFHQAHALVWIGDGSDMSNNKIYRAFNALSIYEQNSESPLINRLCLLYNKFSNKTGKALSDITIKNIGGAPRYDGATTSQIVEQLSKMDVFDKIF